MDRVKYKEQAKKMIEGNKWYIWKPQVFFSLIAFGIAFAIGLIIGIIVLALNLDENTKNDIINIVASSTGSVISIFEIAFAVAYSKYCLDFVRGKQYDWKEVLKYAYKMFVPALILDLLVGLNVTLGAILLIVPGIMAAIGLMFANYVFVDNEKLRTTEILKKAWNITNGHKMDLFIFSLSFIGWMLLVPFTLGILSIWLVPYMTIATILVYEDLKKAVK